MSCLRALRRQDCFFLCAEAGGNREKLGVTGFRVAMGDRWYYNEEDIQEEMPQYRKGMNRMEEERANTPTERTHNTILIVDDDEMNRAILENIFAAHYQVEEADNGRTGLEKILARADRLCAVLLDVVMPEMDGLQVLRALKERGIPEQIPIFLITAEARDTTMREAYELGVMDVIGKPVVPYMVKRRVNSVVELFQARRRLGSVVERQQSELLRQAEQIIERLACTEDRMRLRRYLTREFPHLPEADVNYLARLPFKDFGRLSRRFLCGLEGANRETGEVYTVLQAMWETNCTLMELLSDRFTFAEAVQQEAGRLTAYRGHDTVCVLALDEEGRMAAGTSTSGLFMKAPGRVGDSPIVGSGFYCDERYGAAAATGLGEDIMRGCLSYEIVSRMRAGDSPADACSGALASLVERKRSLGEDAGSISLIALSPDGEYGAATTLSVFPFAAGGADGVALYAARADGSPIRAVTAAELEGEP